MNLMISHLRRRIFCERYMKCLLYCGCKWKWRVIIAVNFQLKQLEGRSLKNIRASTGIEPVTSAVRYAFHMCFTCVSHHFTAREDMNSTNWPRFRCVASQLSWSSIAPDIAEITGSNPVEALIFFRLLPSNCFNWKFTAMITLHFLEYFVVGMLHIALSFIDALISFSGRLNAQNHPKSPDQYHLTMPSKVTWQCYVSITWATCCRVWSL